jgi:hypothetical protein
MWPTIRITIAAITSSSLFPKTDLHGILNSGGAGDETARMRVVPECEASAIATSQVFHFRGQPPAREVHPMNTKTNPAVCPPYRAIYEG